MGAFRRFLDALDGPIQAVVSVRPGTGRKTTEGGCERSLESRRASELRFAETLNDRPDAVTSDVRIVARRGGEARVLDLCRELGVVAEIDSPPPASAVLIEEARDHVRDADGFHRTWFLDRFPGIELEPAWWHSLLPAGVRIDLAWHAYPLPTAWIIHHLQRQLAALRASQMSASTTDVWTEAAVPAAEALQRRLAASQERAFRVAVYLTATANTREELEVAADRVEQAARAALARIEPLTFEMAHGRLATLPMDTDPVGRTHVLDTSSLATLFPWRHAELRHPKGVVLGTSRANGLAVTLDPFDQSLYANANIGVFGHSGAGKTYLLSCLALGAYATGTQVFVLDPEHEYGSLAQKLGGADVCLALGSGHALNVLPALPESSTEREAVLGPAVADTVDLVAIVAGGLDESERAQVDRAVRTVYSDLTDPVLRDIVPHLAPGRARTVLERWVEGSLGAMFSAPTNIDLEAPLVVFGMRELRDELIPPVHFLLAEALWSRIKDRQRRRLLIIDELGLLFEDVTLRRFIVALARRIRKYDGSLVFATQNPGDLLASEAGAVVATNPAIHFFGATRPGEAARLERAFELSSHQRAAIESARRGQFLLAAGAERLPIQVTAPPWQQQLMEAARERVGGRPPP